MEDDEEEEITAATLRGRRRPPPISAQSAFSYVPPRRQDPKEHSYYYRESKVRGGVGRRQGRSGRTRGNGDLAAVRGGLGAVLHFRLGALRVGPALGGPRVQPPRAPE